MTRATPSIGDVMTHHPIGIEATSNLTAAQEKMHYYGINHLVVMDGCDPDANPESIISSSDIQKATLLGSQTPERELTVADICTGKAYIADCEDPLTRPLQVMAESHGGTIIVLKEGALAGILTSSDACRLFSNYLLNSD